jgi:hypothetical protein
MLSRDDDTTFVVDLVQTKWRTFVKPAKEAMPTHAGTPNGTDTGTARPSMSDATAAGRFITLRSSPLLRTLLGCFGWRLFLGALATMFGRWSLIFTPLFIKEFLVWISNPPGSGKVCVHLNARMAVAHRGQGVVDSHGAR